MPKELTTKIDPGTRHFRLHDIDPDFDDHMDKDEAEEQFAKVKEHLVELQAALFGAGQNSVLVVLQGMDTSGKDGVIRHVFSQLNPQGCRVESFKVPTDEERSHDFLWRVHKVTPRKGQITVFNRSHYEDVVVVRVHNLAPEDTWKQRYDLINEFERLLVESGTIILKFFLHISKSEQEERLREREADLKTAWKLSAGDWKERSFWDSYISAYEDAIERCSTKTAPWHVVPADKKWFRNLAVATSLAEALRPYQKRWEDSLNELARQRLAELKEIKRSVTGDK